MDFLVVGGGGLLLGATGQIVRSGGDLTGPRPHCLRTAGDRLHDLTHPVHRAVEIRAERLVFGLEGYFDPEEQVARREPVEPRCQ